MQGIQEKDTMNIVAGKWGSIVKTEYRATDIEHAVYVPALQSLLLGAGAGLTVGVGLGVTIAPPDVAFCAGVLTCCVVFTFSVWDSIPWARKAPAYREVWTSETAQAGGIESARVRLEVIERKDEGEDGLLHPGDALRNEQLNVDIDTLQLIAKPSTVLSKRGLMDMGIGDTLAMRILAQMVELRYIHYPESNAPAQWTNRGMALCRAFAGGGAGGGDEETGESDEIFGVGEDYYG